MQNTYKVCLIKYLKINYIILLFPSQLYVYYTSINNNNIKKIIHSLANKMNFDFLQAHIISFNYS